MIWNCLGMILLTLLKIIGILLAILLLVVCLVLFAPVRYQCKVDLNQPRKITGRIYWLGFLLSIPISWSDNTLKYKLRVLGIALKDSERQPKEKKPKKTHKKQTKNQTKIQTKIQTETQTETSSKKQSKPSDINLDDTKKETEQDPSDKECKDTKDSIKTDKKHRGFKAKIQQMIAAIKATIRRFKESVYALRQNIKSFRDFWDILCSDHGQRFICIAKDNMLHLLGQLRPRSCVGKIWFGTDDPALTGQILGIIAVIYTWYGRNVSVIVDFEQPRLEGYLKIKGRIHGITLVRILISMFFNKDLRRMRKDWAKCKGGNKNGR